MGSYTNPHKKMRVDAWVKPFFAITYKANNAQEIIPFGMSVVFVAGRKQGTVTCFWGWIFRMGRSPGPAHKPDAPFFYPMSYITL